MKKTNYYWWCLLFLILQNACQQEPSEELLRLTSNVIAINEKPFKYGETLKLTFSASNFKVDSFEIKINDQIFKTKNILIDSTNALLGVNGFKVTYYYDEGRVYDEYSNLRVFASTKEVPMNYKVLADYFHNKESFTQGLFYENGMIYESSGLYEKSFIAKYTLGSETYLVKEAQNPMYFSEGIAKLGNYIYQLTWRERRILKYDVETLKLVGEFSLPGSIKEGWGITTDGKHLIIADGTQFLSFVTVENDELSVSKVLQVVGNNRIYANINELEVVNNWIYANVWQENIILKINLNSGIVEGILDLTALTTGNDREQVLNGIAKIDDKTLLITGKNWSKMYKIAID